jgi:hypothetical protein
MENLKNEANINLKERLIAFLKLFLKYFIIFLPVPIIGTLLHEVGHYLVAIIYGYEAEISYAYTSSTINRNTEPEMYFKYILGGPISTWILSGIPFIILLVYYNKDKRKSVEFSEKLPVGYLFLVGLTSICGRFIFNAGGYLWTHSQSIDESKMANYLGIYPDIFIYGFAFIAWTILLIIINITPKKHKAPLFFGAILGAVVSYFLWYELLGPFIMPN